MQEKHSSLKLVIAATRTGRLAMRNALALRCACAICTTTAASHHHTTHNNTFARSDRPSVEVQMYETNLSQNTEFRWCEIPTHEGRSGRGGSVSSATVKSTLSWSRRSNLVPRRQWQRLATNWRTPPTAFTMVTFCLHTIVRCCVQLDTVWHPA